MGSLWSLPVDLDGGKVTGPARKLLAGDLNGNHPDVSADGTQPVYCSMRNGPQGIWIRNLLTGKDRLLAQSGLYGHNYSHTVISPDGKIIAAALNEGSVPWRLVLFDSAGGDAKPLHVEGARLRGWTPDGRMLLLWARGENQHVAVLEVASGERTEIVKGGSESRLSRDGRWLAFVSADGDMFVTPFRGSEAIPESERIRIAEQAGWPAWAPNGQSLYFIKLNAGGAAVMFRQVLEPGTKRPIGAAKQFHSFEGMSFRGPIDNPIAVGRGEIILSMGEASSDIWAMDLPVGK